MLYMKIIERKSWELIIRKTLFYLSVYIYKTLDVIFHDVYMPNHAIHLKLIVCCMSIIFSKLIDENFYNEKYIVWISVFLKSESVTNNLLKERVPGPDGLISEFL